MAKSPLDYFPGTWHVKRTITDALSDDDGTFEGIATFTRRDEHLDFEEVGVMQLGAYRGRARRRLYYRQASESSIDVSFLDGHHFVSIDLSSGTSRDVHLCERDRYDITTVVHSHDRFDERWRVSGPSKDYEALTLFERLAETS
ncbi:MAG: DUF6314 family protein [Acidimicrobiales bacterium]